MSKLTYSKLKRLSMRSWLSVNHPEVEPTEELINKLIEYRDMIDIHEVIIEKHKSQYE